MNSRYQSLYGPFLSRDMCVSINIVARKKFEVSRVGRSPSMQRVPKSIRLKETALTGIAHSSQRRIHQFGQGRISNHRETQ